MLQVDEVKNIMVDNIERVLERGEKIELLVDKTDNLRFQVMQLQGSLANLCLSVLAKVVMVEAYFSSSANAARSSESAAPLELVDHRTPCTAVTLKPLHSLALACS